MTGPNKADFPAPSCSLLGVEERYRCSHRSRPSIIYKGARRKKKCGAGRSEDSA